MEKINFSQEKIIHNEQLFQVPSKDFKSVLHRSIGALTFMNKNKKIASGSGAIISPDLILTAAHNIYSRKQKSQYNQFRFYLGADGIIETEKFMEIESWRYLRDYMIEEQDTIRYDFALLKLKQPLSLKKYLPLQYPCKKCLDQTNLIASVDIFGYPLANNYTSKDKCKKQQQIRQFGLSRKNSIIVDQSEEFILKYAISTLPGQSGAPVCVENQIIAVHCAGAQSQYNVGRVITLDALDKLQQWRIQLHGKPFKIQNKSCSHRPDNGSSETNQKRQNEQNLKLKQQNEILKWQIQQLEKMQRPKQEQEIYHPENVKVILENARKQDKLDLTNFEIKKINLRKYPKLKEITLDKNQLENINLNQNTCLNYLFLRENRLVQINLRNNIKLSILQLSNNRLVSIDLSRCLQLAQLNLDHNQLETIDLSRNTQLIKIDLSHNLLMSIDLSRNAAVTNINLADNRLTMLNLSFNKKLVKIMAEMNNLQIITLWYYSAILELKIQNQCSEKCELTVLYPKKQKDNCKEVEDKIIRKYHLKKDLNEHKCTYTAKYIEFE